MRTLIHNCIKRLIVMALATGATAITTSAQQAFGTNDLAVVVAASATANNTTVSVVEITKALGQASPVQTISIPGTGANAIVISGSATSTGYAANSADGSLFCFTGHNSTTAGNANTLNPRAVVTTTPPAVQVTASAIDVGKLATMAPLPDANQLAPMATQARPKTSAIA